MSKKTPIPTNFYIYKIGKKSKGSTQLTYENLLIILKESFVKMWAPPELLFVGNKNESIRENYEWTVLDKWVLSAYSLNASIFIDIRITPEYSFSYNIKEMEM